MASADVYVGLQHGETCTCHKLDTISVTPVIVHDDCPGRNAGQDPPCEPAQPLGRIAVTWPSPRFKGMPLGAWEIQIDDLDTGQPILTATGMRIAIGGDKWESGGVYADLTMLVDDDGQPILNDGKPVLAEDGKHVRTGVFRYAVVEMRVAEAKT